MIPSVLIEGVSQKPGLHGSEGQEARTIIVSVRPLKFLDTREGQEKSSPLGIKQQQQTTNKHTHTTNQKQNNVCSKYQAPLPLKHARCNSFALLALFFLYHFLITNKKHIIAVAFQTGAVPRGINHQLHHKRHLDKGALIEFWRLLGDCRILQSRVFCRSSLKTIIFYFFFK